ncbi:hypothetical protein EN786_33145 [Mesorhizobium sp. M4B.F.Ca.ET.143.01.1.1]|nr:hypothetical protein EOA31_07015 [Mesorhizobium sp. M4B.F.Ca.ET.049.02.1.2]TGV18539.1 hypothetical protein EN786_33145 [Mesorhizobium sp. M4B.F.Ca.ET.143.01.1.1]
MASSYRLPPGSFPLPPEGGRGVAAKQRRSGGRRFLNTPPPTIHQSGPGITPPETTNAGAGRPPLRRASLDTSPPIDGGEERRPSCSHWLFNPETGGYRPSSA